jgi:hypothetical protein
MLGDLASEDRRRVTDGPFVVLARLQRRLHFATSFVPKRPPSMAQGFGTE